MESSPGTARLGRRLLLLRGVGIGGLAAGTSSCVAPPLYQPPPPQPVYVQPVPRQVTDSDPVDGPGNGRGYAPAYAPPVRQVTDSDPNDGPGRGRGYGPRRLQVTDSDPNDGPGRGRGYR